MFVAKRYPGAYWLLLDAICDIAGYFPRATLGVESLTRRTGLSTRYVEKMRARLVREGVLQLVTQSVGGRFTDDQRPGAPGKANEYAVGPAARSLPLRVEPRPPDRGRTPSARPGYLRVEPRPPDRGTKRVEPRPPGHPTHGLSGEVSVQSTLSGEEEGMGEGKRTVALTGDPTPANPTQTIPPHRLRDLFRDLSAMKPRGQTDA